MAANVIKYGTGALNIDACRVKTKENLNGGRYSEHGEGEADGAAYGSGINVRTPGGYSKPEGRWPANLIHDGSDEVLALFPSPHGAGKARTETEGTHSGPSGLFGLGQPAMRFGDFGSAARFFYAAKASKRERNRGLPDNVTNSHPTVKPIALMRYLCRLVAAPNSVILDPFMGSGSTGLAARDEGFRFIGIENDDEAYTIAEARLSLRGTEVDE